jgi:predicted MPP superfamily phosphohydrolase
MGIRHGKSWLGVGLGAAALGAYSLYEPYRYRLRTLVVPARSGAPALDVLHVSDTHMTARSTRLAAWLTALPDRLEREPDLVLATGDFVDDDGGIEPVVTALAALEARLGRYYVLGSHDYYQSRFRLEGYLKYFRPDHERPKTLPGDTLRMEDGLRGKGWIAVTNATEIVSHGDAQIRIAGVDDPYLRRHRTEHIHRDVEDAFAIGLVHAPDVVSEWLLAGFDLVLAGHTHGGQVRFPIAGAAVTNCSLPAALAGGLHRVGGGWLHVSPGLGSGRFAPVRFNRPPEATLLKIRPE